MSNVEYYTTAMRGGARAGSVTLHDRLDRGRERSQPAERFGRISGMIETAENLAREYQITREAADAYAAESQQRAARAWAEGRFADELVPIEVPQGRVVRRPKRLAFPLIVKSVSEEASFGISQASIVEDDDKLSERVAFIHGSVGSGALIERYIEGCEFYVGVIGNGHLRVLPVWEDPSW